VIYIGLSGSNSASGASAKEPMADPQAAVDKGLAPAKPDTNINVRVLPGTCKAQHVKITADSRTHGDIDIAREGDDGLPLFDGEGSISPWLNIVATAGADRSPSMVRT
jgi:hypothetical protein